MSNASSSTESSTDLHPSTSLQNTLYVDTVGAAVRREQNHFVVTGHSDGTTERLRSVPLPEVAPLALVGRVHCTMLALRFCPQETVQVVLLSPYGKVKGRLHGRHPANVDVRLGQYAAQDKSARRLELARRFVGAKVHNMRRRLRRTEDDTSYRAFRSP